MLITDKDLDGKACAVLFRAVHPFEGITFIRNKDQIDSALSFIPRNETVYVTDGAPSERFVDTPNLFVFDHHETNDYLESYPNAYYDTSKCGAMLFFNYLNKNNNLEIFEKFIELVNIRDLWKNHPLKEEALLLDIYAREVTEETFISSVLRYQENIIKIEKDFILPKYHKIKKYIEEKINETSIYLDEEGFKVGICYAVNSISDLGHEICDKLEVDYAMLLNKKSRRASLRSNGLNVCDIAVKYEGGGHKNAACFTFSKEEWRMFKASLNGTTISL